MTRHCGAPMLSWSSCNSPVAQLAGSKDPAFLPWTRKSAGFRSSHRDTPAPTHAQGTVPAGLRGIHVAEGNWDPIFKRKHPSSGENTPLPPAARNSRHSMALALRASFAVRRCVVRLQSPARGEGRFWGNSSQAGSDHAGRMPAAVGPLRCGAWWRISPQGGRQDVGHRFVGTGMCRRNGPTPCADFQHMDVLKAQSLGCPSFWFRLSWTSKKDEPAALAAERSCFWSIPSSACGTFSRREKDDRTGSQR